MRSSAAADRASSTASSPTHRPRRRTLAPDRGAASATSHVGDRASIWFGAGRCAATARASTIGAGAVGAGQRGRSTAPSELPTVVGEDVVVGHGALLEGCVIEDGARLVGMGAIVLPARSGSAPARAMRRGRRGASSRAAPRSAPRMLAGRRARAREEASCSRLRAARPGRATTAQPGRRHRATHPVTGRYPTDQTSVGLERS